jgi:Protein of unknown function (DUF2569)
MATQCKLCGLHIPDGVQSCMICGNKNFATVTAGQTLTPSLPTEKTLAGPGHAAFSKWLWVVAISLILTPVLRVMSILNVQIPALYGDENQVYLQSHPGLSNLIYFEIGVNSLLVASALVLNFMFYTKRKKFPMLMVCYVAATVLFLMSTTAAINSLFPDANMTRSFIGLVRMLIWAGALIPYLLTSSDIKTRFVN